MNRTRTAATTTQMVSTAGITSLSVVAASMRGVSAPGAGASFARRTGFARTALYGGTDARVSAPAEPVVDEVLQLGRRVRQLNLLCGDSGDGRLQRRLPVQHDRLAGLLERLSAGRHQRLRAGGGLGVAVEHNHVAALDRILISGGEHRLALVWLTRAGDNRRLLAHAALVARVEERDQADERHERDEHGADPAERRPH